MMACDYGDGMRRANVRIFHASPDAPPVDVYLNSYPVAMNLAYKSFTPYFPICPGRYIIRVFPAGTMDKPVIDQMFEVRPQDLVTLAIVGRLADIGLLPVGPSAAPLIYGKAFVRFVHLSPNAPRVDVAVQGGPALFQNVGLQGDHQLSSRGPRDIHSGGQSVRNGPGGFGDTWCGP